MNLTQVISEKGDVVVGVSVVAILGVMILPVPPFLLDILLSLSISLAIVILITSIYIRKPLDFSVFPSILLITTLFRLSLNVASTRLVLLRGNEGIEAAGEVIKSFGNFIVGGNYAVGFTLFLILVVVNFVVITKGSGRIAEVAARFTLDAMPGKQMAIEADLNAGLIEETEARRRRSQISQEADFYGAMDGASKFVRGDAIAGLIITAINIVGGFIIGTLQKGLPVSEAAKTYTLLTIGDGLVSQMPALLISTAAGIVVSRAGTETDLGKDITRQVLINPKSLATASGIMVILGLVPGLPHLPFLILSAASGAMAFVLSSPATSMSEEPQPEQASQEDAPEAFAEIEPLTLEIGYGLIPLVESDRSELLRKIKAMRKQLANEFGFVVPPIHVKDNLRLRPHEYTLAIRALETGRGEVMVNHYLAVASGAGGTVEGVPTTEPAFGLPGFWINEMQVERAQAQGFMVVDPATVIATHITELIKNHAWELLTRGEVQHLLEAVSKNYPKIVDELIPSQMTLGGVQRVLQNLLRERVPINDLTTILETLLDYSPSTKDVDLLAEYVRQALSRYLMRQYVTQEGVLSIMALDPGFEIALSQAMDAGGGISPDVVTKLMTAIERAVRSERFKAGQPIVLCSAKVRRFLRRITERFAPSLVILSSAEIPPSVKLQTIGVVRYEDQNV